jgi:2-polyprenyl-6-methoxyphenol hydroxylase-like FAD-dependent oxidoreductase
MRNAHVLIVGAGPTGMVLALWLTRLGVPVRLIDNAPGPGTTSRALAVQARTLELYSQIGIADEVVTRGRRIEAVNLWVRGERRATAVFGKLGAGVSPFPYALVFPQDAHERLLVERLADLGVEVERHCELLGIEDSAGRVLARLRRAGGAPETFETAYVAGCDGAHSAVRNALGIGFGGGTYQHLFYVADVRADGAVLDGELHVAFDDKDFLIVFPLKDSGNARLVGTVRDDAGETHGKLSWNDVSTRVIEWLPIGVSGVNWFSTYRVHHRVAEQFRKGRAFLLGDAAHIHSPVGGQGMNTGIGDAVNLAWKLAAVLNGRAPESLLASYEPERIAFAHRLVKTTDRAFSAVTSTSSMARWLKLEVVPHVVPLLFKTRGMRRLMFRTVSQVNVHYRTSALSAGSAGTTRGGDRLPWVELGSGADNFAPLQSLEWQVHVYGEAPPGVDAVCAARGLPLHVFPWNAAMGTRGLEPQAVYLVRPDGYVGLAAAHEAAAKLTAYLEARGLFRSPAALRGAGAR